jgi:c-di-GMP-binding flagellar brake protein YcgR
MTKANPERRSRQRLSARLPLKVRQADGSELDATTRDLSSTGIFLYSQQGLQSGTKIELVITVPASLGIGPGGWALCQASVVRVEEQSDKGVGVAASLDRIELLPEI